MASDYIFKKSAFGGFNREDVIAYISTMKAEESIIKNELAEEKAKNAELANMLQDAEKRITEEKDEFEARLAEINESHRMEIERIKQEYEEKLQNSILADRSAEEKVGTAMLDVRRYADLLIHETCEKIDKSLMMQMLQLQKLLHVYLIFHQEFRHFQISSILSLKIFLWKMILGLCRQKW